MRPTRLLVLAALTTAGVGLTPAAAHAHALKAVVTFTTTEVKVLAAYDDDTPAGGAKVTVTTADNAHVADGTLDATGSWRIPLPAPGKFVLIVDDIGHRDRVEFTIHAPTADQPPAEVTYERWRLDKTVGLAVGLGVLLGGTLLYAVVRRKPAPPAA